MLGDTLNTLNADACQLGPNGIAAAAGTGLAGSVYSDWVKLALMDNVYHCCKPLRAWRS